MKPQPKITNYSYWPEQYMKGGPNFSKTVPTVYDHTGPFRDEITYEDGILYKGAQLIMPETERKSTLKVIHMGHYAIDKMNLRAKETVYWLGIRKDIKKHLPSVPNLHKVCQESTKGDTAISRNTTHQMGTTWFRHFLIARNTISSNI